MKKLFTDFTNILQQQIFTTICNVLLESATKDIAPSKSVTGFYDVQQLYYGNA